MKCSNCGFENAEDAKFCGSCGNELENFLKDNDIEEIMEPAKTKEKTFSEDNKAEEQEQNGINNTEMYAGNEKQQQEMDNKINDSEQKKPGRKRTVIILGITAILVLVSSIVGYSYFNNPSRQFCSLLEKGDYVAAEELVNSKLIEITEEVEATFVDVILKYGISTLENLKSIDDAQWDEISTLQNISKSLELPDNSEKYIEKLAGLQTYREDLPYFEIIKNNRDFFDDFMVKADGIPGIIEETEKLIDLLSGSSDPIVNSHKKNAENILNKVQDLLDAPYFLFEIEREEAVAAFMTVRATMLIDLIILGDLIKDINRLKKLEQDLKQNLE